MLSRQGTLLQRRIGRLQRQVSSIEETFILASWRADRRPERPLACQPVSVGNASVTCHSTKIHGDWPLLALTYFLVDILGEWFYVTAGHILRDVGTAIAAGSEFDVWRLDDQTAGNRFSGKAVPYAFDLKQWFVLQDDSQGFDYQHLFGGICN